MFDANHFHIEATLETTDSDKLSKHSSLGRVSTDNVSLTKILCHRNFGNEIVFTNSKDYLYYLARSTLSQIFDRETSPQN